MKLVFTLLLAFLLSSTYAQYTYNVRFEQSGKFIIVSYSLLKQGISSTATVSLFCSTDGGITWGNPLSRVTGDVGKNIKPGTNLKITWDVLSERTFLTGTVSFKVKADVGDKGKTDLGDIEMVFVQGGTFQMGSNNGQSCEKPVHSVSLSNFYIGKTEVTQKQWRDIMNNDPSYFKNCDNCPVENITWNDIQDFIQKLNQKTGNNFRLPTEAEWEYAARGGSQSKGFTYSGSNNSDDVAWYSKNSDSKTHPVGKLQPNELGIFDMSGNVWEWCNDLYSDYSIGLQTNPTGPSSGSFRVDRGGGWNRSVGYCRSAYRNYTNLGYRYGNIGFRLAFVP